MVGIITIVYGRLKYQKYFKRVVALIEASVLPYLNKNVGGNHLILRHIVLPVYSSVGVFDVFEYNVVSCIQVRSPSAHYYQVFRG